MASRKNLKKDINYLTYELVSDCYIYTRLYPGKNTKEITRIISESISLRDNLIHRVNNIEDASSKKSIAKHYKGVEKDLLENVDKAFETLSKLVAKPE